MQKTEFQLTGYLSRKSDNGTWSNRYVSLSTDTGAMKFYVEKSGKKSMKSQINIKKGKLTPLSSEEGGKPFAFHLLVEEMLRKSEDANLILAAADESQYNDWLEGISLCFTITDGRRRKSTLLTTPLPIETTPAAVSTSKEDEVVLSVAPLAIEVVKSASSLSPDPQPPLPAATSPSKLTLDTSLPRFPLERSSSKEEKKDSTTPKRYETIEVLVTSDSEDGASTGGRRRSKSPKPSSPVHSPTSKEALLEEKLEKMGKRKSYKPPKKLGNLLNSKGLTPEVEEEIKRAKEAPSEEVKSTEGVEGIALVEEEPPAPKPRQLVISVRPTSPIREGYLFKLDNSMKEIGEDPWISQFVSLEISSGILQFYAELGGRRIPRGKVNIIESTVEPIDLVYHGRLYAFKLITVLNESADKLVSTFAAEDLESFSYWLISFDDCFKYIDELKERKEREEEEKRELEAQRMQLAAARSRSLSNADVVYPALERIPSMRATSDSQGLARKGSMRLDHLEQRLSHDVADQNSSSGKINDMAVNTKAVTHQFFEDPGPLSRTPSFKTKEAAYAVDDMNSIVKDAGAKSRSRSFTTGGAGPIIQLNENNSIDDLLKFDPSDGKPEEFHSPTSSSQRRPSFGRARRDSEHEMMEIKTMEFHLKNASYPADRLARRVKIWYCSGGFSLSSEEEINQFVDALKNSEDTTLKAFSEEKFEHIHDWSNLLEVLRKYEQKVLAETLTNDDPTSVDRLTPTNSNNGGVKFVFEVTIPSRPDQKIEFEFTDDFDLDELVKKLSETFGYSELSLLAVVPPILANKENPWSKGLVTVKEDLLFAEDLVLYQEEVIEHMWESYTALKQMISQKDEVINQLYNQHSDLQDKVAQGVQNTLFTGGVGSHNYYSSRNNNKQSTKELQVIADREFYAADKDGDGRISREEWRNWIQDKHNLIQEHNEVKTVLMNEIKTLRKALSPQTEQIFNDIKKFEDVRRQQEEDLVKVHIENDKLKSELNQLQQRLKDLEEEKNMIESDFQEKIQHLQKQLESTHLQDEGNDGKKDVSAASNLIDSPYAYNYALDRSTGLSTKRKERPAAIHGTSSGDAIDLMALASMNDKYLSELDGAAVDPPENHRNHPVVAPVAKPWQVESYPGETSRLGVDHSHSHSNPPYNNNSHFYPPNPPPSHLVNVYPQTLALRSPEEEDYYASMANRQAPSARSYLNNLQEQQQQQQHYQSKGRMEPNRFSFDDHSSGFNNHSTPQQQQQPGGYRGSTNGSNNPPSSNNRRSLSPSALQSNFAAINDHPLRNALRQEKTPNNNMNNPFAANNPYAYARTRNSTTNYNHTINSKMKPTRLKTGTVINDKVVANPAASLGPRNPSPNRLYRNQPREDTIYEYSSRLPSTNHHNNHQSNGNMTNNNSQYSSSQQPYPPPGGVGGDGNRGSNSPSRFMLNTNSWKQKINQPHIPPDLVIRAGNWKL